MGLFFMFELQFLKKHHHYLLATDEVGRGPLAGPVVSCAVRMKNDPKRLKEFLIDLEKMGVTDSKKLTTAKRIKIIEHYFGDVKKLKKNRESILIEDLVSFVIREVSPRKIDEINILQASLLAMKKAVEQFGDSDNSVLLIDGNKTIKNLPDTLECFPIVKGDSKSVLIALASVFAKEYRDQLMERFGKNYPGYGLEVHSGYPTKAHLLAIEKLGVTSIHRKTFKGVKEYVSRIEPKKN